LFENAIFFDEVSASALPAARTPASAADAKRIFPSFILSSRLQIFRPAAPRRFGSFKLEIGAKPPAPPLLNGTNRN
jgi:hypothetical protein